MTFSMLRPSPKRWSARTCDSFPIKTDDQLDLQALHRVRERLVSRRTAVINQIRAFLLERDVTFRKGRLTPGRSRDHCYRRGWTLTVMRIATRHHV